MWQLLSRCRLLSTEFVSRKMAIVESLKFDNLALKELPLDPEEDINQPRQVSGACFSNVTPTPVKNPHLVAVSLPALALLDLSQTEVEKKDFAKYFSGNKPIPGSEVAAHCYCGHQFGHFSGQLGDGAAMYLGEVINQKNERWEIQLKGAGLTPYSRQADGRKVLRSSIREFLCSEAMHHLGIPTTRAGTCVTSDTRVTRDIFYTGNVIQERATIILRIAPTFIRFGSFEICKQMDPITGRKGPSVGQHHIIEQLLNYSIKNFYPQIWSLQTDKQTMYVEFYKEVIRRTARLVASWQCVGWCHGVLNTDNMSIVGLTIDYGPYGFLDSYDPDHICNASDDGGRYTYIKQPEICRWNCLKLAEALEPIVSDLKEPETYLHLYDEEYEKAYIDNMRCKLGLLTTKQSDDIVLVNCLLDTMAKTGSDFTNTFRGLSRMSLPGSASYEAEKTELIEYLLTQCATVEVLRKIHKPKMDPRQLQMMLMMLQMNPDILSQMGMREGSLRVELDRIEKSKKLKDYTADQKVSDDRIAWTEWLEMYTERLKLETEGVDDLKEVNKLRTHLMNSSNPRFILRNYVAQSAIDAAEKGDYSEVNRVLRLLETPYSNSVDFSDLVPIKSEQPSTSTETDGSAEVAACSLNESETFSGQTYDGKPPEWAMDLRVT